MSTETTPAAPKASASVFHEEIVLIAEKLGELHDRFERIESEHVEQRVPLDAAKSAQDAALAALTAALQGMKALNFHVLDNNLGAVSKRVEAVEKTTAEKDAELAAGIQKVATALTQVEQVFRRDLSAIAEQKTELGRKVESDKQEAA
jgi:monomeric isocitrate dehydrogenase